MIGFLAMFYGNDQHGIIFYPIAGHIAGRTERNDNIAEMGHIHYRLADEDVGVRQEAFVTKGFPFR